MEKTIKCALFDLDGTLINTITDLGNACDYVIKKHNFDAKWSESDYLSFVGNGMKKLVERAFKSSLSDEALNERLAEFKEYYNQHFLDNTDAYRGIKEQLAILKDMGIKLCVITNKAEDSAVNIVEHIFGKGTFDIIVGQRDNLPVKPDPAGVNLALKELGLTREEAIYFGDSEVDMQTAQNAGVEAIGVSWGFRSFETLFSFHPSAIIDKPEYISKLF